MHEGIKGISEQNTFLDWKIQQYEDINFPSINL